MDEPSLLAPPSEDATDAAAAAALRVVNDVTGFDGCLLDFLRTVVDGRLKATTKADVVVVVVVVAEKAHHHKHKRSDDEIVIAFMVYVVR
jgi:hypothetical protein